MMFTTITFLIFLAIVFPLYWSLRSARQQNVLLIAAGYIFYGWWDWRFCGLLLVSSLVDFWAGHALERTDDERWRRRILTAALSTNLGILGLFKYFNFFTDSFATAAASLGWHVDWVTLRVVLPVGISFYTFQSMSYSIDVYRRRLRGTNNLIDYMAFVSFFPQLVAGPIERAGHMLPQFTKPRRFDYAQATDGCRQILWGFVKKLLVADTIAPVVQAAYSAPRAHGGLDLAVASLLFTFQIYFDFSAYSDIAVGLGKLFGFQLMRNFAYPYFASSLGEFWRRWHISLSTWFRDYVFIPLGGSRTTPARHAGAIMTTFLLSGLWHGAAWTFVVWGGLHGAALLPESLAERGRPKRHASDVPGGEGALPSPAMAARMLGTFAVVCVGWVFFRAATLRDALFILRRIGATAIALSRADPVTVLQQGPLGLALPIAVVAVLGLEWVQRRHEHPLVLSGMPRPLRWATYQALLWLTVYVGTIGTGSPFIYFQF
jgi:alginate O-acetyltransferase complex protein AlgI